MKLGKIEKRILDDLERKKGLLLLVKEMNLNGL